jgi:DNA-binding MarR family transcriptional regulator
MEDLNEKSLDELLVWAISVDRRQVLLEAMKNHTIIKASDIAHETKRSTQNISRALREFEEMDLIKCLTPDKVTWKKYVLTNTGKQILKKMEDEYFI